MKKLEKILLIVLCLGLAGRMAGLLWCRGIFTLTSWVLALVYVAWGYHYLRRNGATPTWLAIISGFGLGSSMFILPFLTFARRSLALELIPILNIAVLVLLLVRYLQARRQASSTMAEGLLRWRSAALALPVCFLAYIPPIAPARAVIKILNRGDVELVAIMDMLEEREAFEAALAAQDCSLALQHAERAYAAGRIWLFGPSWDRR